MALTVGLSAPTNVTQPLRHRKDVTQSQFPSDDCVYNVKIQLKKLKCSLVNWVECSLTTGETGGRSLVESYQRLKKCYFMSPCLTLIITRYGSMVRWSNPGKRVAPSPTPLCCSYWKGSLRFALDYDRQLLYIYDGWLKKFIGWLRYSFGIWPNTGYFSTKHPLAVHTLLQSVFHCLVSIDQKVISSRYNVILWTFQLILVRIYIYIYIYIYK